MAHENANPLSQAIGQAATPLVGEARDFDPFLEIVGDARFVLLGEATHGTHEFYRARAEITRRLIEEKGFTAVAVEADWPDAYRVNRYVRGLGEGTAADALAGFERFPQWMWRNADVLAFIDWLRAYNDALPPDAKAGFYGLDLYSLYTSIEAVLAYLESVDPEAARQAGHRYACFENFRGDPQAYGFSIRFDLAEHCEDEAVQQLVELRRHVADYVRTDGGAAEDEFFFAEQNARLIQNAEAYYRGMYRGRISSWNLRDRHMAETLEALCGHLSRRGTPAKIVVWEHNSHIGDARATQMGWNGELNVGQLVRERYGKDAVLAGFTTYDGTVMAASDWGAPAELKRVRPALPGSYEDLFHATGLGSFLLNIRDEKVAKLMPRTRLERAIGVIYLPETERISHYFEARLAEQFDAVLHYDRTRAVEPLERIALREAEEPAETYPVGV
ncbi:erythromycin esterase family protein [Methylocaldum sp.]|uniref:erythromycin esterase family protein n=1 Tax=Methylocaldum sp. TaxID=1969727 RepID=UPI002D6D655A|nr:erythromycin esterase family protein [Methylocaldum sp.]HYE34368.1 erythromycin esterase family protein [Methylocaldum sp.]